MTAAHNRCRLLGPARRLELEAAGASPGDRWAGDAVAPAANGSARPRRPPGRSPGAAPRNRLLEQFVAIPSGNPRNNHTATLILTIRLRPGIMKSDGPGQRLQLGLGQRIAELLAVCRRAGALHRVDRRLQGLISID